MHETRRQVSSPRRRIRRRGREWAGERRKLLHQGPRQSPAENYFIAFDSVIDRLIFADFTRFQSDFIQIL